MDSKLNSPALWREHFPWPDAESHKYLRGHAVVAGGPIASTGAARLAALNALRVGAGLVSIACDRESLPVYAASCLAVMTKLTENEETFRTLIAEDDVKALLIGPGAGVTEATRARTIAILATQKPTVLDADALTCFAGAPEQLFNSVKGACVLTPHEGEFSRLFWNDIDGSLPRETRAVQAAKLCNAILVLKGAETLIASPDGQITVNRDATPFLATAGAGDALAGICLGLLAQGMPAYEAACAAVWLHTQAASRIGPGLIAEDIARVMPATLSDLYAK